MKTRRRFTICIVSLAWASAAMGATLHVDAGGGGDYTSIQAALDAAFTGHDDIEVDRGTYYEAIDFRGKAVRLYSRHGPAKTIIDGTGNYHVVRCVSGEGPDTILEGFTITGGNANGEAMEDTWGGGMYNVGAGPTVANCAFTGNSAIRGGAMFNIGSPSLTDCVFHDNSADRGGAMYNEGGSPAIDHCTFQDNSAARGGGIFDEMGSNAVVTQCTFRSNHADEDGGGICNGLIGRATVTDCTFTNNDAGLGGGIASIQGSGDASGCTFLDNTAGEGGAIYYGDSAGTVSNCTFRHNLAGGGGGAISNGASDVVVTNCVFTANGATGQGGAILNVWSDLTATHCTFTGNTADVSVGGIMSMAVGSTTTVTNCILWADTGGELDTGFATLVVTYSDIDGGWEGEGNIGADPRFVEAATDFHLAADSPCVDAGTNDPPGGLPDTDIEGNPRLVDGDNDGTATADMGAYEFGPKVKKAKRP